MHIAFDYDDTITRDVGYFRSCIHEALKKGHKAYVITMRGKSDANPALKEFAKLLPVIYTAGEAKKNFVSKRLMMNVDVWVDDSPNFIFTNALASWVYGDERHQFLEANRQVTSYDEFVEMEVACGYRKSVAGK